MKEVEVKAKVRDKGKVIESLKRMGCRLSKPITQKDRIFLEKGIEFRKKKRGTNVLRIRKEDDQIIFTLKKPLENELDCIEKEVIIDDAEEMENILGYLGVHKVIEVNKKRMTCRYNSYKICVDDVEGLGNFIEVEKMTEEDSLEVQEELFDFLMKLGIKKEDRVMEGYDTLNYKKKEKKKTKTS